MSSILLAMFFSVINVCLIEVNTRRPKLARACAVRQFVSRVGDAVDGTRVIVRKLIGPDGREMMRAF